MGLLENFESRLDQLVNGAFARAFRDVVEPVEIASRIQREMDRRAAVMGRARTVVPNRYTVELSSHDYERLAELTEPISEELAGIVKDYATEQRYTFLGGIAVEIEDDPTLDTGLIRVRSETKADAHGPEGLRGGGSSSAHPRWRYLSPDQTAHPDRTRSRRRHQPGGPGSEPLPR